MTDSITTQADYDVLVAEQMALLVLVTSPDCSVCTVLKPKITAMLNEDFPLLKMVTIDSTEAPDVAAQLGVFSAPTVLLVLDGREYLRQAGAFSMAVLHDSLIRPYTLFLEEQ